MKKAILVWFCVVGLVVMGCSPPFDNDDSFGSVGTLGDSWIEIWDWYDADAIRDNLSGSYVLMTDLDSTTAGYEELAGPDANGGAGWEPVGASGSSFGGTLDGQGYSVMDLFIDRPSSSYVGLFARISSGGRIDRVGVTSVAVSGYAGVGSLAGYNVGTVSNSHGSGSVTGYGRVGGLIGWNHDGTVIECHSTVSVTGTQWIGGLVGSTGGIVRNSYSLGSVGGSYWVGGLVASNWGTVANSHYNYEQVLINGQNVVTTGALSHEDFNQWLDNGKFLDVTERLSQEDDYYWINDISDLKELLAFGQDPSLRFRLRSNIDLSSEPDFYIPYLAGRFDGDGHTIANLAFNFDFVGPVGLFGYLAAGGEVTEVGVVTSQITGLAEVGPLVGWNAGTVSGSYATGSVTGNARVGGLVGWNRYGTVANCYSGVNVTGQTWVGGATGINSGGIVSNSYFAGNVDGNGHVGGLVGYSDYGTVNDSFWDMDIAGIAVSAGGIGKTTAEMKDIRTFCDPLWSEGLDNAWDITGVADESQRDTTYIWNTVDSETYPFLSWEQPGGASTRCTEAATGTGEVCFTTSHGVLEDLTAVPALSPAPRGVSFPHGMFEFRITGLAEGATVTLTIELPEAVPDGFVWWKHDGTRWHSLPIGRTEDPKVITLTLTDGVFPGDITGVEDGTITDPGGPGNPVPPLTVGWESSPTNKAAVMAPWITLFAAIVAGASLLVLRRRQTQS